MKMIKLLEHFHSIQGEGAHVGRQMHFLRLPGCNMRAQVYCRTWNGLKFKCDTDLSNTQKFDLDSIIESTWEDRVCITGGEPFIPQNKDILRNLVEVLLETGKQVHIETNGTCEINPFYFNYCYVACSPKAGYIPHIVHTAHEIRILINDSIDPDTIPPLFKEHRNVFVSPVFHTKVKDYANIRYAVDLLKAFPKWRLSVQVHKLIGVK
jgi:7-carboxy-7-deazaguanine synthase